MQVFLPTRPVEVALYCAARIELAAEERKLRIQVHWRVAGSAFAAVQGPVEAGVA